MDTLLKAILDVWNLMISVGYDPIPTAVAVSIIFIGRERFVRPLRNKELKRSEGLALNARYRARIMYVSWLFAFLTALAIKRPVDMYDVVLVVVWSAVHTAAGTLLYDHFSSRKFMASTGNLVRKEEDREDPANGYE